MPDSLPDPDGRSEALPRLQPAELETLLAALDPLLDGFGDGASCLYDAMAFLARLGVAPAAGHDGPDAADQVSGTSPLLEWIERWRAAGGNRRTMRLMVKTLLALTSEAPSPEQG